MTSAGLQILSRSLARSRVLKSLRLRPNEEDSVVRVELIRALVWTLSGGHQPVHVLRLLNRALDAASGLADTELQTEALRAALRESLDDLSMSGDLVELDGGLWLPAPTRLIPIAGQDDMLIIGGLPTRYLTATPVDAISCKGAFRFISRNAAGPLSLPLEDMDEWARRPEGPLETWAQYILALPLPEYEHPTEGPRIELYLPERAPAGAPQFKRWSEKYGDLSGTYLARRFRAFGSREYRVVQTRTGRVTRSGAVLARGEARRLMYALDSMAGNCTRGRWTPSGSGGRLVLTSVLPHSESRICAALGHLSTNPDKLYEQQWTFPSHAAHVHRLLSELSIQLTTH